MAEIVQSALGNAGLLAQRLKGSNIIARINGLADLVCEHPILVGPDWGGEALARLGLPVRSQFCGE